MRRLIASLLLAIVACAPGTTSDGFRLKEWAVDGPDLLSARGGPITVENAGEWSHTLVITTDRGQVVAASGLIEAGTSITLDVPLDPGQYQFSCRIVAEDDEGGLSDHYEQGMSHQVTVGA
jgi:hypothetical protein